MEEGFEQRIRWLADQVGGVAALARLAGLSRTLVQGLATRGEEATDKSCAALANATGVGLQWLTAGGEELPQIGPEIRLRAKRNIADCGEHA